MNRAQRWAANKRVIQSAEGWVEIPRWWSLTQRQGAKVALGLWEANRSYARRQGEELPPLPSAPRY